MNVDTDKPVKTARARHWFRFRLRTLLILVTLLTVPLGWVGWELDQSRKVKATVAWVEEMGGAVHFISVVPDQRSWWEKTKVKLFGEPVSSVSLGNAQVSDLSPLAELKDLKSLHLNEKQVSDLSPLAKMKNLKWLYVRGKHVGYMFPPAELKNLEQLWLNETYVSDEQVQMLKLALPNIKISID